MTDEKPLLLDLFCKAGGAGAGYARAGFDVIGVDIEEQKHYPHQFYRGDVFTVVPQLLRQRKVALVHASPPCQFYSGLTNISPKKRDAYPDLLDPTRELLKSMGLPYIIENVAFAPLEIPTMLCGSMFGLGATVDGERRQLRRHRFFESNQLLFSPGPCDHTGRVVHVYGNPGGFDRRRNIKLANIAQWREAMGIPWMNGAELAQAIPPAMSEFLGRQLIKLLDD